MAETSPVTFRVFRFKEGDRNPHHDRFEVEVGPQTSVLDGLVSIRRFQDPTLILRHSCFHASCGTCGMRVNGREVLACVTNVRALGASVVTVEPLANVGTLLADLVVEMDPFYERFAPMERPLVRHSELGAGSVPAEGVEAATRFENCIECGLCVSACPISSTDSRYIGPAALAAAWRVVSEPRTSSADRALAMADVEHGIWRCHTAFECTEACPSNVDPAGAIMQLRRRAIRERVRGVLGGGSGRKAG
jgi:succinate dehydrogenase / fumarate reductase, iron-sulfur subunit